MSGKQASPKLLSFHLKIVLAAESRPRTTRQLDFSQWFWYTASMTTAQARRLRVGTRVKFTPQPVSLVLYSARFCGLPPGTVGTVTKVSFGYEKKSFLPGPGGGLLYVDWGDYSTCGVAAGDVERA